MLVLPFWAFSYLFFYVGFMQGTLRSCSKAKVEAPMLPIEQVHFFIITID
jgi:hypothetical protein